MDKKERYLELDALRGLAALLVVVFHFTMFAPEGRLGFYLGVTGVDLFFIISGFVIFMSLEKTKDSQHFLINRLSRLYPTYWVAVSITYLLIVGLSIYRQGFFDTNSIAKYLANLTMFQHYLGVENLDSPYWTMILELTFYLSMYVLLVLKKLKHIHVIAISIIVFSVLSQIIFPGAALYVKLDKWLPFISFVPLFYAGIVFYKMMTETKEPIHYVILAFCWGSQVFLMRDSYRFHHDVTNLENALMLLLYFSLFLLFMHHKLKFIVNRVTVFLGKISFTLYLSHQFISSEILIPFLGGRLGLGYWQTRIISLIMVILLAHWINVAFETRLTPVMKRALMKLYGSLSPKAAKRKKIKIPKKLPRLQVPSHQNFGV